MQVLDKNSYLNLEAVESVESALVRPGNPFLPSQGHFAAAEKFRLLAHRLNRARAIKPIQTVLVTSAVSGEGKSTISLNLASVLAAKGTRTLLIDADLRLPDIEKLLSFCSTPGLGDVLRGDVELGQALRRVDPLGLYCLAAGGHIDNPLPLLEGSRLTDVLRRARETFEWIIIDSPPFNPLADAQCIASFVDAIMLVVRWAYTPKDELNHAVTALEGLPLLGLVVNRFDEPQGSYYYSYHARNGAKALSSAKQPDNETAG